MSVDHCHALPAGLSIILDYPSFWVKPNHSFSWLSLLASWDEKKKCFIQQKINDGIPLLIIFFYYLIQKVGRRFCSLLYPSHRHHYISGCSNTSCFPAAYKISHKHWLQARVCHPALDSEQWLTPVVSTGISLPGFFFELGWDNWKSPWVGVMSSWPKGALPGVSPTPVLNVRLRAPWSRLL